VTLGEKEPGNHAQRIAIRHLPEPQCQGQGTSFSYLFPPLSLTLFTFAPGAARLAVVQAQPTSVQLQLQGQPGTPYVIQSSTNLAPGAWIPVSTNRLAGSTMTFSLPTSPGTPMQYYRAVWQP
jgi:hypothetical protein